MKGKGGGGRGERGAADDDGIDMGSKPFLWFPSQLETLEYENDMKKTPGGS